MGPLILVAVFVLFLFVAAIIFFFSKFLYSIGTTFYFTCIRIASLFNRKARAWTRGRKKLFARLQEGYHFPDHKRIWIHCASLGEFEQGRTLIEKLREEYPDAKILLTFFSPSGYEVRKNYTGADYICYLPADSKRNAKRFLDIVKPDLVLFIKYEFWLRFIEEIYKRKINLFVVSANFRKSQIFFKWYGKTFTNLLRKFTILFVQHEDSAALLEKKKIKNYVISGDTRFDRVLEVFSETKEIPEIKSFMNGHRIMVAGSTWKTDENILKGIYRRYLFSHTYKLIVAPHEVDAKHLKLTKRRFKSKGILFSELATTPADVVMKKDILIIDNVGMLSSLYRYGDVCYIGGGFNKGVHNILEAAVYGKPIFFGPKTKKFREAKDLIEKNAAFKIYESDSVINDIDLMNNFEVIYTTACSVSKEYVTGNAGATEKVMAVLKDYL